MDLLSGTGGEYNFHTPRCKLLAVGEAKIVTLVVTTAMYVTSHTHCRRNRIRTYVRRLHVIVSAGQLVGRFTFEVNQINKNYTSL